MYYVVVLLAFIDYFTNDVTKCHATVFLNTGCVGRNSLPPVGTALAMPLFELVQAILGFEESSSNCRGCYVG